MNVRCEQLYTMNLQQNLIYVRLRDRDSFEADLPDTITDLGSPQTLLSHPL